MSSRYYLPLRHDFIAKFVYEKSAKKANPDCNLVYNENQFIKKEAQIKFWWNVSIITAAKVKFNKTDSLICGRNKKTCKLVQFNKFKTITDSSYVCTSNISQIKFFIYCCYFKYGGNFIVTLKKISKKFDSVKTRLWKWWKWFKKRALLEVKRFVKHLWNLKLEHVLDFELRILKLLNLKGAKFSFNVSCLLSVC